eukprot:643032-Amphidinium_carterae.1
MASKDIPQKKLARDEQKFYSSGFVWGDLQRYVSERTAHQRCHHDSRTCALHLAVSLPLGATAGGSMIHGNLRKKAVQNGKVSVSVGHPLNAQAHPCLDMACSYGSISHTKSEFFKRGVSEHTEPT